MTIKQAATYLGVKVNTMRYLRRTKQLPFAKIGAELRIRQPDLEAYIDRMTEPARTGPTDR